MNPHGNPQNLKKWPKGVSGNPSGRSKAVAQAQVKLEELSLAAVDVFAHHVKRKNLKAAEDVVEHTIPKPAQELITDGELKIIIRHVRS